MISEESLKELISSNKLIIEGSNDPVKGCAVKLHLGSTCKQIVSPIIDLNNLAAVEYKPIDISGGYNLHPNDFLLVYTFEKVTMPEGYMGWIETRGSLANIGLQVHFCDAHIDPGSSLNIALQIKNNSNAVIKIRPEIYIAKMYIDELN